MNQEFKNILASIKFFYGKNQAEIATTLGVSRSYISNIAAGIYPATDSILNKLSNEFPKAFQVEIGKENMNEDGDLLETIKELRDQVNSLTEQNKKLIEIIDRLTK